MKLDYWIRLRFLSMYLTWSSLIIASDYVIDYRLSQPWREFRISGPRWLSHLATCQGSEMSVVGPVSPVPLARRLPEEMCVRRRPERWLAGWLASCEAYESVQIGLNDAASRVKAKVRGDQFAGKREQASERASEKRRGSLSTRGEIDFERETWNPKAQDSKWDKSERTFACARPVPFLTLGNNCSLEQIANIY